MYDAWKKKVMPDTTRIYYIDTWFLSQNLPYYQPQTLTSFTLSLDHPSQLGPPLEIPSPSGPACSPATLPSPHLPTYPFGGKGFLGGGKSLLQTEGS